MQYFSQLQILQELGCLIALEFVWVWEKVCAWHIQYFSQLQILQELRYLIALEFVWVLWNVLSTAHAGCIYMVFQDI